jgi:adenosylmethionine---8-amino-7-oxononanoate aminotransferase
MARLWPPYTVLKGAPDPLIAASTHGARIRLADGRALIDGVSSWWTACHGYNHPAIVAAMTDQLNRMPHIMFGGLTHDPAIELADRLCAILPGAPERVFLSDSGSVAIEVAMKMAVQYWRNQGQTGRTQFISFQGGYHGDTMAAMSVSDPEEGMHQMFAGYLPEQIVVPLPRDAKALDRFDETLQQHRGSVAAVLIEPLLQAAGGMKTHDAETLRAIAAHAAALDIPLIADEIATGFGRTGTLFACEQAGVAPDIICVGKALTGGAMSLAATAANTRIVEAFQSDNPDHALMHGPTFMANPLACAAANASLTLFETEPRLEQVANMESHFQQALAPCRDLPGVIDLRIKGAVAAIQVTGLGDNDWLKRRFIEEGVWLRPFGDIIYAMPPFVIEAGDLTRLTDAIKLVVAEWSEKF